MLEPCTLSSTEERRCRADKSGRYTSPLLAMHTTIAALRAALVVGVAAATGLNCSRPLLYPADCCTFTAPPTWNATFVTTKGNVSIHAERAWSPFGSDRLYSMFMCNFFGGDAEGPTANAAGLFRVVTGFVVQFGIPGVPAISAVWANAIIPNDPVVLSNVRGTLSYAAEQDGSGHAVNRTTQLYFNCEWADGGAPDRYRANCATICVRDTRCGGASARDCDRLCCRGTRAVASERASAIASSPAGNQPSHVHTRAFRVRCRQLAARRARLHAGRNGRR